MKTVHLQAPAASPSLMVILTTVTGDSFSQAVYRYQQSSVSLFDKQVMKFNEHLRKTDSNKTAPEFDSTLSFSEYMQQRLNIPQLLQYSICCTDLTVRFTISGCGTIINIRTGGATKQMRDEAERIVAASAHLWKPAMQNNIPVDYDMTQKIIFRIELQAAA
jgi:hypothetical protein